MSLSGKFIKAKSNLQQLELQEETDFKTRQKRMVWRVLKSTYVSNFMVALVLFDAYCTCADIDSRAVGKATPKEFAIFSDLCLVMYTIELFLNMAVKGREIFMDWTMILDVVIIMCGYGEFLLTLFADNDLVLSMGMFRAFRLARIVRLMRLLRKTRALRELQKLVTMMATCLKALVWSSVFCFFIMSVWAMFMVEVVHPIISEPGLFDDCVQCQTAAGSVMNANLLLFKTVIAGDSWGLIAVPVIQAYPATAFIFIGSQVTLVFGVLNLIVAVVVDTFAEARQRDILNLAEELEYDFEKDRKFLQKVFDRMDADGSGLVTFEELVEGARRDPEFQSRLRVMDIDEADLQQLFEMIDIHEQGYINATEFIAPLSRWVHDSKTAPRFIKYNLQRTMNQQEELFVFCQDCFNSFSDRIEELSDRIEGGGNLEQLQQNLAAAAESRGSDFENLEHQKSDQSCQSRSSIGSLASDGSKLDLRTEADSLAEGVEQPHLSKKVKVTSLHAVDELTAAMDSLERYVLTATEGALKKSMAIMGTTLRLRLASSGYELREHHVSECGERRERDGRDGEGRRHRKGHELRRREKPAKGGGFLGSKEEGFSGIHSSSSSWALGKTFSVNSTTFGKERCARLPAGTFAAPKGLLPTDSEEMKDPLSQHVSFEQKKVVAKMMRAEHADPQLTRS